MTALTNTTALPYARDLYTPAEIAAYEARITQEREAREQKSIESLKAATQVTLSEEGLARAKAYAAANPGAHGAVPIEEAGILAARQAALAAQQASSPDLAHPLYSDASTGTTLVDFQSFFRHAHDAAGGRQAIQDALYDAVKTPSARTDTTDAVAIGLVREKLNVLSARYVPAEHREAIAIEIDTYVNRLLAQRDQGLEAMARAERDLARSLDDGPRTAQAEAELAKFAQGDTRAQREMREVLEITTGSVDAEELSRRLTEWYGALSHRDATQNAQFEALLRSWQQSATAGA